MNVDPSGNMFISLAVSSVIDTIKEKMHTLNEMAIYKNLMSKLRIINTVLTIYDTGRQVVMILNDPEIPNSKIAEAIARGIVTALFINKMCKIKALEPYVKLFVIGFGMYGQGKAIEEAAENGQWDLVIVRSLQLFIQVMSLPQTCFTGETPVATENGQIRIDEIEVGDKVWAYDIFTGETALKEVTKVYIHEVDEILHLYTSCGDIDTTTNHPFYVLDKGWVAAGDLVEGDEIYLIDGSTAYITGSDIEKLDELIKVYNFEVQDFHTYFVGDNAVLVHNYHSSGDENGSNAQVGTNPESKKVIFPKDPNDFNPEGLTKVGPFNSKTNGKIIKWLNALKKAVFEWDEETTHNNPHYHVIGPDGNTRIQGANGDTHFYPGDTYEGWW